MDSKTFIKNLQQWLHLKSKPPLESSAEPSIPSELFSALQMQQHGNALALSHELTKNNRPDILLARLAENEAILVNSYITLSPKTTNNASFSPATEWLLDNFYLIQEQIQTIRRHLPKGYGRSLPQLVGSSPGYPRVYDIALQIIEHGDGRWDIENLNRFMFAYQAVTPLTLGELWAVPITLGVALIENLGRASKRLVADKNDHTLASVWADRMTEVAVLDPKNLVIVLADMARSEPSMSSAFVAELTRRLQGAALALPLSWIEQHLVDEGSSIEELVQEENKRQAANQVTISNSIASLRRLGEIDWRDFVEEISIVEQVLRMDPAGVYSKMDFGTRDQYRHVIERLARATTQSEGEVAFAAIQFAQTQAAEKNPELNATANLASTQKSHVGFYLIGDGLPQLEKQLGVQYSVWQKLRRLNKKWTLYLYLSTLVLITGGLSYGLLDKAHHDGLGLVWLLVLGIVIVISASQLALDMTNFVATLFIKPKRLPRMDCSKGIPADKRTLVAVPAILNSPDEIETLIEALEVRFLGNRDNHLHFMLLTDFKDAPAENLPDDNQLLDLVQKQIHSLNERYPREGSAIFLLAHRPRLWNASENVWMGRERKRGKLADLNKLLRAQDQTNFSLIVGDTTLLASIKYIITLDSDTQLPRESAHQFVGTMMHPMNQPHLDPEKKIVIAGYGILQPRVAEALPNSNPTRYVRLCGNEFGIDPYTRTVSDVYQDLFDEGSFIGKGIYDLDLFDNVLSNRFPDNRILSHDLLEGCYLRSGYLSDVPLYEKSPNNYLADVKRRVRWIRGDWQLIDWLFPRVKNADNQKVANPLSLLSKIKLGDNLRRSLVPIALVIWLALSFTILPATFFWPFTILTFIFLPTVIKTLIELMRKPPDMLVNQHVFYLSHAMTRHAGQLILYIACLPYEAWYTLVAILRTANRMLISKRHLLEWTASEQLSQHIPETRLAWIATMWFAPVIAILTALLLISSNRFTSLLLMSPLLVLWLIAPLLTRWLSKPRFQKKPKLSTEQIRFLHTMARKTWRFFETFVTVDNHWLPPDNFQEAPIETLARRTSPTNMGLAVLANLTAYDFGYINIPQLLERTKNTLQTMLTLERYRGHLYNWYDTETLLPLLPRYISTVDSGNLAGHLLTLRQGLLALPDAPLLDARYLAGLQDTWDVLTTKVKSPLGIHFEQSLQDAQAAFTSWASALTISNTLCVAIEKIVGLTTGAEEIDWANKLLLQCYALRDEMTLFARIPNLPINITLREIVRLPASTTEIKTALLAAQTRLDLINTLAAQAFTLAQMDISFLHDEDCHLMTIGYNVDEQRLDPSNYDLLSSEARLGIFVAIAQGQILQESWFALGRLLVASGGEPILISWSGSMFEYLMPLLVMPTYPYTLLDQTYHAAVQRQIAYGKQNGVPWGVSESGFSGVDNQFNYMYRAFGVPGLGLKRGLEEELVVAPYASAMALMVEPEAACENLQLLAAEFADGKYGFYEAIDFTQSRLTRENKQAIVRSFMTHHQGMTFLSFSYLLHDRPMQKRFMADPLFQATLLLLQERIPKPIATYLQIPKTPTISSSTNRDDASMRIFNSPNTRTPQVQLLSNGRYHVVITQAGGGYSRWKDTAITRWREDSTCDNWGLFCYVRDIATNECWSTSYQPTVGDIDNFKAVFTEAHADFSRNDKWLDIHTEVVVSPEDDIELRRIRIHNRANISRTIELTTYGEIVLTPQATDMAQPAFSNLFVETELLPKQQAILAKRRASDEKQHPPWLLHILNVYAENTYHLSFETDRARFIGRTRTPSSPLAMLEHGNLSNTAGAVLDPMMAIRCRVTLPPDGLVSFDMITGVADNRENAVALVEKYQDLRFATRIFELAWTHGQVLLHQLNISEADAQLFGRLAGAIIYASNTRRADPRVLISNWRGQSSLWGYSISGDLPIVLLRVEDAANIEIVRQLIKAQAYWHRKGLKVDLVILNEERTSYRQPLQELIMSLITVSTTANTDHGSNIILRSADQISPDDKILLEAVARVILSDKKGTLKEQLSWRRVSPKLIPTLPITKALPARIKTTLPRATDLQFFNGLGGFSPAGDEYIIHLAEGATTPAPWINILVNPNFGTLVSESGQGYTWTENSQELRLTPWENDPLTDAGGEAFYLRDEETGLVWSPTALPCRGIGDYHIRHGFGYSVFEHSEDDIHTEMWVYVAFDAAVKFVVIKVRNDSARNRRLSATGFVEWVLGDKRVKNLMHVITEATANGAIIAQNHYNTDFGKRTVFFDAFSASLGLISRTISGDRTEFLGRNGSYSQPSALKRKHLSGRVGAGLDPCAAIQLTFDLAEGQTRDVVFTLGAGHDKQEAETLLQRYDGVTAANEALKSTRQYWHQTFNTARVTTPDPAVDFLANGWLLYQVLSSRLWGRTGYYQSSGAFGFRDQLQDTMALTHIAPALFRAQLLLCASRQYEEGDVQHWWHPPQGKGVRTRCSDDFLWLPFALCHYLKTTGDKSILEEKIPFLHGRPLNADEESYYELPTVGTETFSLYQHAVRAITHGLKFGVHGLPLMGSGDWNDGMNLVGKDGRGESVWLGFFLYSVLKQFAPLATQYGDEPFATRCANEAETLRQQIETHGWDGEWYRRAYFDDGTPLGSATNTECRIDSIAQSWATLSSAAEPARAKQALVSLERHLVNTEAGLIKLLDPPFDKSKPSPGYIEGYVPGIRENGGQYTHGAVWAVMAFAEMGEKQLAWKLFNLINPINHGRTAEEIGCYKIEPYVTAGDVYSQTPHTGRGGWSWYSGSGGWLYRLVMEILLGIQLEEGKYLRVQPLLPDEWNEFSLDYRVGNTVYKIAIRRGEKGIVVDGVTLTGNVIELSEDGKEHEVEITI